VADCRASAHPQDARFSDTFLIVTPGITIRDRLRVLLPSDPNNYYKELDIVPAEYRGDLGTARIVVTNFHTFKPREKGDAGGLTKIHNQAVSGVSCAAVGLELGVPQMLREAEPDRELAIPARVLLGGARALPEVTEALIGACFLTFGFERVAAAVVAAFGAQIEYATEAPVDAKSALQELLARRRARVSYAVIAESGPAHRRTFEVEATVGEERVGTGTGRSKKAAEQVAAEQALKRLGG